MQLLAKNANKGIFQLIAAWLPCEDTLNCGFFLMIMNSINFDVKKIPFMSDRGHSIAAARFLRKNLGIIISDES